jgi:hypothetical protein
MARHTGTASPPGSEVTSRPRGQVTLQWCFSPST